MTVTGVVTARNDVAILLRLRSGTGPEIETVAVVDTGYSGTLALPARLCLLLGLPVIATVTTKLADGTVRRIPAHSASVLWCGSWRTVTASAVGTEALVGMALLDGHRLEVDVVVGGEVMIRRLVARSGGQRGETEP